MGAAAWGALLESGFNIKGFITGSDPPFVGAAKQVRSPQGSGQEGGRQAGTPRDEARHPPAVAVRKQAQRKGEIADKAAVVGLCAPGRKTNPSFLKGLATASQACPR